jgi:raffinose/stachyose/melibiose transport system permease protein
MRRSSRGWRSGTGFAVVFLAPAVLLYSVFTLWPLADTIRLSLFTENEAGRRSFAGLGNYVTLFTDPLWSDRVIGALRNNLLFFLVHMLVQNPVALLLAGLLSRQHLRLRATYRAIIFLPVLLSQVIVGFIWQLILNPLWGVSQTLLGLIGLEGLYQPWLGLESSALITLALISVWQWVGLPMILFYTAMLAVPEELSEAAKLDGAGEIRIFLRIKLPLIMPTIGLVAMLTFIGNFNAFDLVYVTQGLLGGPNYSTDLLGVLFYRTFFGQQLQLGSVTMGATVASLILGIILLGVCAYRLLWQRRVTSYEL